MQAIIKTQEFLNLSASLNYQLSAAPVNWRAILALTVGDRFTEVEEDTIIDVLTYLQEAYGQTKRRLGPAAVLHPIRTMGLLARTMEHPTLLDLLTTLLHDKQEDLTEKKLSPEIWRVLESHYQELLKRIDPTDQWYLNERIDILTIQENERYYHYLGRVLERARLTPELVRAKLADRLDNTLDLRMDLHDPTADEECYEAVFAVLFTDSSPHRPLRKGHPIPGKINGSRRLYQLFKNSVLLSLLRRDRQDRVDRAAERLSFSIARASLAEAQRILLHLFDYHVQEKRVQREILQDVMEYCRSGSITRVTPGGRRHRLDGLFKDRFDQEDKATRNRLLDELYQDKYLMAEAAVAFMAIFSSFMHDPDFRIHGIDARGIHPDEESAQDIRL
jgi:hypothetical protein